MRGPLDEARKRAEAAVADARRGLSLLDGPLTAAKQTLARQRLQRAGENLAVVWLALGQLEPEPPFIPLPQAAAPETQSAAAAPERVIDLQRRRRGRA